MTHTLPANIIKLSDGRRLCYAEFGAIAPETHL
jgi:hypothetical protein